MIAFLSRVASERLKCHYGDRKTGSFHEQAASQLNLIFQSTCALITERDRLMSQFGSRTSYCSSSSPTVPIDPTRSPGESDRFVPSFSQNEKF